jgi:hypothetical protein
LASASESLVERGADVDHPGEESANISGAAGATLMQRILVQSVYTVSPLAQYDRSGVVAFLRPTIAPASHMRFTPQPVVNWLYQALAHAIVTLQAHLIPGKSARFNSNGEFRYVETNEPASGGEVCVVWGTEIGARRDQALIAWDYDVDLAVFKTADCDFSKVWQKVKELLEPLGLQCLEHDPGYKFRIAPLQPVAFSYSQERRHAAKLQNPRARRADLGKRAKQSRIYNEPMQHPTGINCVDIEVHDVTAARGANKRTRVVMHGANGKIDLTPHSVFPIVEGIFGPLRVPVPRTTAMLVAEYGGDWGTARSMKVIASNCGSTVVSVNASGTKRSAWPSVGLLDCLSLLGGFWGAGLTQSDDDVSWRFL